jgi:hypothetical protein
MEHMNFACGHCGQLMAVPVDNLGQPVLCPHCQHPVQPPTAAEANPPPSRDPSEEPVFTAAPPTELESIFNSFGGTPTDDIFGSPAKPLLEMPAEPAGKKDEAPAWPVAEIVSATEPAPGADPPREAEFSALPAAEPVFEPPGVAREPEEPAAPVSAWPALDSTSTDPKTPGEPQATELPNLLVRRPRASGKLVPILLMFLIPYSIVVTVWGVRLYLQLHQLGWYHRLETLPDPEKGGAEKRTAIDIPLPEKLQVALKEPLQVGDLEVIPQKVEETPEKTLVLTLTLRNIAKANVAFRPLTPKLADFKEGGIKPYTYLDTGQDRIYGGKVQCQPFTRKETGGEVEVNDGKLLPGESLSATLTTLPNARAQVEALEKVEGELLWRVQLRRGFVQGEKGDFSATAVVGVKFSKPQIQKLLSGA